MQMTTTEDKYWLYYLLEGLKIGLLTGVIVAVDEDSLISEEKAARMLDLTPKEFREKFVFCLEPRIQAVIFPGKVRRKYVLNEVKKLINEFKVTFEPKGRTWTQVSYRNLSI